MPILSGIMQILYNDCNIRMKGDLTFVYHIPDFNLHNIISSWKRHPGT